MTAVSVQRPPAPPAAKPRRRSRDVFQATPLTFVMLLATVVLSIFPLYYMIVVATREQGATSSVPPPLIPGSSLGDNIGRLLSNENAAFMTGMVNSAIISLTLTVSVVFLSTLAGFAFAKLRFRGRNALMLSILVTMMVPAQLGVVPLYMMMAKLQWANHLPSVIVPFLVNGFGVFMMRQYVSQSVPDELIEAARVDGCNTFRIYWSVVLPALRPAIAVLALFTFMAQWNEFFWASLAMGDPSNPTVQISLQHLSTGYYNDYAQVFAGTLLSILPLLAAFILFGRQIIGGIMEGALKA
ncbi:carbohydrate ABC transporter permease [Hamadaea sp. NPDC050747]|uniref:carbohydrate ABC transporter permease n=1 Tax=Hamadaea sp. NPDC050747 TaxID=3155789 RepID=UPI0033CB0D4A